MSLVVPASRVFRAAALSAAILLQPACARTDRAPVTDARRAAIADTLRRLIVDAYDITQPGDAVARLMSLYPSQGRVVSANGGQYTTSRDSLEEGIRAFWDNVGRNMREPAWQWGPMQIDVLGPDAAVMTTTYRVPHHTPAGMPHVIAGAWTAVFQRRGERWVIVQEHLSDLPSAPASP